MGRVPPAHPAHTATPRSTAARRGGRRRRHRLDPAVTYTLVFGALLLAAVLLQVVIHGVRTDPRDTSAIVQRELQVNTLAPGERIRRSVPVIKRSAINYFRATHGILALTNRRLLYLGVEPRDLLAAPDLPPTFEERDFALDTLARVSAGRTFFGFSKAVVIETPAAALRLGVTPGDWPAGERIIAAMAERRERALALAIVQRRFLARVEAQRRAVEAARHQPHYYIVQRGDALATIAIRWNTTPERLRAWNHLSDNRILVGQKLLVRPAM